MSQRIPRALDILTHPVSPNFDDLWEANVKSMKSLLIRTMGTHNPTFEELSK